MSSLERHSVMRHSSVSGSVPKFHHYCPKMDYSLEYLIFLVLEFLLLNRSVSETRSLVILTSRFEATRELFWDGPRNFEPRSDYEDDT
ncbi:hypothetical protein AVEN_74022-1 [Araneus ventricosus]|uniref:Uncharacterized protein n=1 Tax=Araneus ventricosus TaxID=182803 RepID=A0A4Y2W1L0_ARAVE|nr:hypothetical protein AVEN_74022-1 [Araneus ventricosus]